MKILVDENVPRMTVAWLRELGHHVKDIRGTADQGLDDPALWTIAMAERRLRADYDFTGMKIGRGANARSAAHYGRKFGRRIVKIRSFASPERAVPTRKATNR